MKNVIIIVLMSLICGSAWAELTVTQLTLSVRSGQPSL